MSCLVKFGFGGVQDFIAQARMTRDLAAGSRLIQSLSAQAAGSGIIKKLASQAAKSVQSKLVLPSLKDGGSIPEAFPHQFVFRVEGDIDETSKMAEELRESVIKNLESHLYDAGVKSILSACQKHDADFKVLPPIHDEAIRSHIRESLDIYWVALEETGNYTEDFDRLTRLFDDRRHTRTFAQIQEFPNPPGNEACSQCGVRPRIGRGNENKGWFFSKKDRLCAVCAGKRMWSRENVDSVPSTYMLSRARFYRSGIFSGKEAGEQERLREVGNLPLEEMGPGDREFFKNLSPYWGMVVYDGDEMGKWFSGEYLPEGRKLEDFQKELANAMGQFAEQVGQWCKTHSKHFTYLVYTGGDDGLILAPLDWVLPLARTIHGYWVSTSGKITGADRRGVRKPTLSLHISVLHAKGPLQPAVADLHGYLSRAKDAGGRDCFSVLADVRSGSPSWMVAGWEYWDQFVSSLESLTDYRVGDLNDLHAPTEDDLRARRRRSLPARIPHKCMEAIEKYYMNDPTRTLISENAILGEWRRLIGRTPGTGDGKAVEKFLDFFKDRLVGLPEDRQSKEIPAPEDRVKGPEALMSGLEILSFLSRELSWGGDA